MSEGPATASICILTDFPRPSAASSGRIFFGWEEQFLSRALLKAGISPQDVRWESIIPYCPAGSSVGRVSPDELERHKNETITRLNSLSQLRLIVPLGELPLSLVCGRSGIDKWHLSPLDTQSHLNTRKVVPTYHPERVAKEFSLQVFVQAAFRRAAEGAKTEGYWPRKEKRFLLNPPHAQVFEYLADVVSRADVVSIDIETGRGQINTVGFATSASDAIAINVLPEKLAPETHHKLWAAIGAVLESPQKKVLQNLIYETLFFSRYGFHINNYYHDTMWAQKFLYPELTMGLDTVGRLYTNEPYWKDEGKNWNDIRDWERHYNYNCLDTTGTFEGHTNQRIDLANRGLLPLFDNYLMRLADPIAEMCSRGLPLSLSARDEMTKEVQQKITEALTALNALPGAEQLNPKSNKQVKEFLEKRGYQIPKKYDSATKQWKPSTDEKSLKKLRVKHPEDPAFNHLLALSRLNKAMGSYLTFDYDKGDNRMRFSLNGVGTETGRMSSGTDPWDRGMNAQTVPGGGKGINIKKIFVAPEGYEFLQCDLRQAESRFVAYDSCDTNLIAMLEDPTKDIHKYVAAEIFQVPEGEITKQQRQLGKKSGHGANYSMKEATFIDSCLSEMDLVLSKKEATNVLEAYHRLFPGIRQWHARLRKEVSQKHMLSNPFGRQRYFYGRTDDDMFREAYAYRPQSTIPDITNHLMLYLLSQRDAGELQFNLLLQCHDSILLEVTQEMRDPIASACLRTKLWHPMINLPAGRLVIPTEVETGKVWGAVKKYEPKGDT